MDVNNGLFIFSSFSLQLRKPYQVKQSTFLFLFTAEATKIQILVSALLLCECDLKVSATVETLNFFFSRTKTTPEKQEVEKEF